MINQNLNAGANQAVGVNRELQIFITALNMDRTDRAGSVNLIRESIASGGFDVNRNLGDCFALHLFAQSGNAEMVDLLIQNGANVREVSKGSTALFVASQNGHTQTAFSLIRGGADLNVLNQGGITPLYIASQNNHIEMVDMLLQNGADVNLRCMRGLRALHIASEKNNVEIVSLLMLNRANPNILSDEGFPALIIAVEYESQDVAVELIRRISDMAIRSPNSTANLRASAVEDRANPANSSNPSSHQRN